MRHNVSIAASNVFPSSVPKPSSRKSESTHTFAPDISESPSANANDTWKRSPPERLLTGRNSPAWSLSTTSGKSPSCAASCLPWSMGGFHSNV